MSDYEPNSRHLREVLIFCFNMKKSAAEAHRMLSNTYGEAAISERTCREWFQRFKNGDFHVEDRHSGGREKIFDDAKLEALLSKDPRPSQEELARSLGVTQQAISKRLKDMGMIQNQASAFGEKRRKQSCEPNVMADEEATPVTTAVKSPAAAVPAEKAAVRSRKVGTRPGIGTFTSKAAHPLTADMVTEAIASLKERGGSSLQAIEKYIAGTFMIDADRLASYIKKHIKTAVASGALVQTEGKGASASFKLPTGKTDAAKNKRNSTRSTAAKKAVSPKKTGTAKKSTAGKKLASAAKTTKKPVVAKKPAAKKPVSVEKSKKALPAKAEAAKSPSKVKKVSKAPTTKPKASKPKKLAAPRNTSRKAAAAKK